MSASGPPPPIFSFEITDMPSRAQRTFGVYRGPREGPNPERIDRWSWRGGDDARDSVPIDQCPALRPLLEQAVRLPLPSPVLARLPAREYVAAPNLVSYRLKGRFQDEHGNFGYLEMSAFERHGAQPSRLARWALDMEAAFQTCLDRRGPAPAAPDEGPGDA